MPIITLSLIVFSTSLLSPVVGIAIWILIGPFESFFIEISDLSPYVILTPSFLIGAVLNLILSRKLSLSWLPIILLVFALTSAVLATVFGSHTSGIRPLISVVLSSLIVYFAVVNILRNPQIAWVVIFAVIMSALVAAVYAIFNVELSGWRLQLDTGVRELTNPAGLALASLLTLALMRGGKDQFHPRGFLPVFVSVQFAFVIIFLFIVFGTLSRGAIMSLGIAAFLVLALYFFKMIFFLKFDKKIFYIVVLLVLMIGVFFLVNIFIADGRLAFRIFSAASDPGENTRWIIWQSAISSLEGSQWIYGAGLGSFSQLAYDGFYSHSVYVGALVEMGLLGLIAITAPAVVILVHGIRFKGIPFVFFWSYMMAAFLTHGSLYTKWYFVGLIAASAISVMVPKARP